MIKAEELKDLFVLFPTGVTVVTAIDSGGTPTGLTAGSFAGVSLDPPLMGLSINNTSRTLAAIRAQGSFGVHILGDWQADVAGQFGREATDKFAGVAYQIDRRGVPCLEGCLRSVTCDLEEEFHGGNHSIVLGRIIELNSAALDRAAGNPLVFFDRWFHHIGARIGPIG